MKLNIFLMQNFQGTTLSPNDHLRHSIQEWTK